MPCLNRRGTDFQPVYLLRKYLHNKGALEVIDIVENLEQAEKDKILATPTLEKASPEPVRRIVGDLSDKEMVLPALGLYPKKLPKGVRKKP